MTEARRFTADELADLRVRYQRAGPMVYLGAELADDLDDALRQAAEQAREVERHARVLAGLKAWLIEQNDERRFGITAADIAARALVELSRLEAALPPEPQEE